MTDRAGVLDGLATALIGVVLPRLLVPWQTVPPLLWAVPVAITAYGTLLAAGRWRRLPWLAGRRPALRLAGTVVAVVAVLTIATA